MTEAEMTGQTGTTSDRCCCDPETGNAPNAHCPQHGQCPLTVGHLDQTATTTEHVLYWTLVGPHTSFIYYDEALALAEGEKSGFGVERVTTVTTREVIRDARR